MLNQIKNIGSHVVSGAATITHLGLEGASNVANMIGKGVLFAGGVTSAVLGYDTYRWQMNQAPIWANAGKNCALPLLGQAFELLNDRPLCVLNDKLSDPIKSQMISVQALLTIALPTAVIMGSYACFKVGALMNRINHTF